MQSMTGARLGPKETEVLDFLTFRVFQPALDSPLASDKVKSGVRLTMIRLEQLGNAEGMVRYFWSAVHGTEKSIRFADLMAEAKLDRFEEVLVDFRRRFDDQWLRTP